MDKKIFAILLIAVCLIMSVGVISASDSISVKVVWEGDSNAAPDNVIVHLLKNGNVVDSAKLNASNKWRTTFKVDDNDGDYDVEEVSSSDFSYSVNGNADEGFVIKNTVVRDVLKSSDDANNSNANGNSSDTGKNSINYPLAAGDNITGNATDNATSNATDNSTGNASANTNGGSKDTSTKTSKGTTQNEKEPVTITTITESSSEESDDEDPVESAPIETGLPIIALFIAVFVAAFIPIFRKR